VTISGDLDRIAAAATGLAREGERVDAVLATEPASGERGYLCAFGDGDGARSWIVLDDTGAVVARRTAVRAVVTIAALCEVAAESAAGGDLDELRAHLVALRLTEAPPGIEEAEEALVRLQRVVGTPPRLATPQLLDDIGGAARALELALDPTAASAFAVAMRAAQGAVEELTAEVEAGYRVDLI
jgi:hypothetical protein